MRGRVACALLAAVVTATPGAWAQPVEQSDKQACIDSHGSAQELRNDKQLLEAREQLLSCAREACPALVRQACADLLRDVLTATPSIVVSVSTHGGEAVIDAVVTLDGAPWSSLGTARDVGPGVHEVRAVHPKLGEARKRVTAVEGQKNQVVSILLGAPDAPSAREAPERSYVPPIGSFVLFGLSAAATVTAVVFGANGVAKERTLEDDLKCGAACETTHPDEYDAWRRDLLVADVSLAVAGATLLGGVVWWVVDVASSPSPSPSSRLDLLVGPVNVGATWTGRF